MFYAVLALAHAFAADVVPPTGTWVTTTTATVLRFAPTEYAIVSGDGADRRTVAWTATSDGYAAVGPTSFTLTRTPGGWRITDGLAAQELRPATSAEVSTFEASVARTPPPAEICPVARTCCEVGMPLLGGSCDVSFQLGNLDSSSRCLMSIDGLASLFVELGTPVPPACVKPGS